MPDRLRNRLSSDGTFTYEYDFEGNRVLRERVGNPVTEVEIRGDYHTHYHWDTRNRLMAVVFEKLEENMEEELVEVVTRRVEYVYDLYNRRIEKRIDADGDNEVDHTTRFVCYGEQVILQFDSAVPGPGVPDSEHPMTLTRRNLYGARVDAPGSIPGSSSWDNSAPGLSPGLSPGVSPGLPGFAFHSGGLVGLILLRKSLYFQSL